ncbi:MAG: T9SS type A sorting domain-containing protein, partial [Bacteroidetes bacterium]
MKRLFSFCLFSCLFWNGISAQALFQESFDTPGLPAGWSVQSDATDGGWSVGTPAGLSSQYFTISSNGSPYVAGTNDDQCNCNKSEDYLILPSLDLSSSTSVVLKADILFEGNTYQGSSEAATIEVSLDKINWTVLKPVAAGQGWVNQIFDLSAYAGAGSVYVAFHYNDNGGWLYGMAVDNIVVEEPATLDAALEQLKDTPLGRESVAFPIAGRLFNNGVTAITSIGVQYQINGGAPVTGTIDGLNISPYTYFDFTHPSDWTPDMAGDYTIDVSIIAVNGTPDENAANNSLSFETTIYTDITPPNRIDEFLAANPEFETVATAADQLDKPTDLDFFPILAKNELWVINERNENSGGSTLTIYDAGTPDQSLLHRVDGNAWHFMSLPTALAFGDNFNWASAPGVKDANHNNGTFTGPTLWSSDPAIYAQPSGGNGSHLDMLHGSPYSMGIAHEVDNVYWVFDGWNKTIVRYDFQDDHGPGNDYHGDALVRRYLEIQVSPDRPVPSHMVLDKSSGWLYIVDNGNDRVLRLDIHSGQVSNSLPLINEPLAEHSQVSGVTWEVIIDEGLNRPCGIELIGNRLLVGDYATGDILVYDMENNFAELGRIATGQPGLTGIKVGPAGNIWFTNRLQNTLQQARPGEVSASPEPEWANTVRIFPNPTSGTTTLRLPETVRVDLQLTDLAGRQVQTIKQAGNSTTLQLNGLPNGVYLLTMAGDAFQITRKIILQ